MHTVHVLIFADIPGGLDRHAQVDGEIVFHRVDPSSPAIPPDGPLWAFVDWDLPEIPGLEICRRLRCNPRTARAHIVMILDEDTARNRRRAAQAGAGEYMKRPADRGTVIAKVLGDRSQHADQGALKLDNLTINLAACQARWREKPIKLMPTQLRLLQFLVEHPGQIFTRQQLMEALGNLESRMEERTVDVWIGRIRRALKAAGAAQMLHTVRSLGYMLAPPR